MLYICVLILLYRAYAPTLYLHTPICIAHLPLLLLYGAQAAQVQGLLRGNKQPAIFLRLPGSSMLDPVCQVLTFLLSSLACAKSTKTATRPPSSCASQAAPCEHPVCRAPQFPCVTGTTVQILTQKALPRTCRAARRRSSRLHPRYAALRY